MVDSPPAAGLYAREFDGLGAVQVGVASAKVISVSFPDAVPDDADRDHPVLDAVGRALAGDPDLRAVDVALTVPTDRRSVLEAVRQVPPGERASLEQVARMAHLDPDDEDDARTVRRALRENPVPPFVPDHRVEGEWATPPAAAERLRDAEARE
ncbi:MAG: methylated DNA-protein cysteine methyltransferase [uncultured archaeon A07HB70]|nr:MAG: methylated DNA-protein cysteine methyltransferase [uncultured archaeon A07HB70]